MSRDPTVRGFWQPAVRSRRVPWGLVQCGLAAAWSALLVQCAVRKSWCTLTAVGIQVLNAMNKYSCKKLHVIGNHELYNFGRARLAELGLITAPYSSFKPHHSWRFIVVDAFDISTPGWDSGHPKSMAAWELLAGHNPNEWLSANPAEWLSCRVTSTRFAPVRTRLASVGWLVGWLGCWSAAPWLTPWLAPAV